MKMSQEELNIFVNNLSCVDFLNEISDIRVNFLKKSLFVEGVLQTLILLGYDKSFVENDVKYLINKIYIEENDIQM